MEIEASTSAVAKKLWSVVRIVFMMMRKGVSKSKIMMELNLLLKRGKLAGKAMAESFILHSSSAAAFSCRSNDSVSFVAPREYEFSCSNSPAFHFHRRTNKHRRHCHDDVSSTVTAVQKMLEMYYLNHHEAPAPAPEAYSPMVALSGFGRSPMPAVRQLRITDSPFPIKDEGLGDSQVDLKAEDFIKKFYKNLRAQKRSVSYIDQSPYREVYG